MFIRSINSLFTFVGNPVNAEDLHQRARELVANGVRPRGFHFTLICDRLEKYIFTLMIKH